MKSRFIHTHKPCYLLFRSPTPENEEQRSRVILKGELPSPIDPPSGCVFRTRCPFARDVCAEQTPKLA